MVALLLSLKPFSGPSWLFTAVDCTEALEDLLPLYHTSTNQIPLLPAGTETKATQHSHELAVLFALFAGGEAASSVLGLGNPEFKLYADLAHVALSVRSIFE